MAAGSEKTETGSLLRFPPPASLTVSIAIKGNRKSKYIVNWALEKFIPEGIIMFNLIHIRPTITRIPTPVGTFRLADIREDIVNAHRKAIEWETNEKLLPYKRMCTQRKVQAEIIQIESSDVVHAISKEVDNSNVNRLVIGASPRGMILRRQNVSSEIAESIQKPCTVYAIAKGKLFTMRPLELEIHESITVPISMISSSTDESSIYNSNSQDGIAVDDFGVLHTIEEEPEGWQNQEVQNRQLGARQNQSIQNRHLGARQTQAVQNRHLGALQNESIQNGHLGGWQNQAVQNRQLGAWQNQSIQNRHLGGWQNQAVQNRPTQMRRHNEIKPMMESFSEGEVTVSMEAMRYTNLNLKKKSGEARSQEREIKSEEREPGESRSQEQETRKENQEKQGARRENQKKPGAKSEEPKIRKENQEKPRAKSEKSGAKRENQEKSEARIEKLGTRKQNKEKPGTKKPNQEKPGARNQELGEKIGRK